MGKSKRIVWICHYCAILTGKILPVNKFCCMHEGICDVCGRKATVTEPRDYGYFTPEQINQAKHKLKEFGLNRHVFVNYEDLQKLIDVIKTVLSKENRSYITTLCLKSIEKQMSKGENVEMFDVKQLVYWYAKDIEFMKKET